MRVKSKSAVLHMLLGSPNYISGQELAIDWGSAANRRQMCAAIAGGRVQN